MKINSGEIIKLDNGLEYFVFLTTFYNEKNYLYLIEKDNTEKFELAVQEVFDNEVMINLLRDEIEKKEVFEVFYKMIIELIGSGS